MDGNHLQEAWEHILTCVSRFEHLHLVGEGAPSDATFFAAPEHPESEKGQLAKTPSIRKKVRPEPYPASPPPISSLL